MQWRTSVVLQSMTWKRPEEWAGEGVDEDEEEGRERLQAIVLVIALGPSNASSPISPRVGTPRVLAALPRPHRPRIYILTKYGDR